MSTTRDPCFTQCREDCECRECLQVRENPAEVDEMHVVIIGGGPAGIEAARVLTRYDHKVALIERSCSGGQEARYGSVVFQKLTEISNLRDLVRRSNDMGIEVDEVALDWGTAMIAARQARRNAAEQYRLAPLVEEGLNVYRGQARFVNNKEVVIEGGPTLKFEHAIIATGAQPLMPHIPGLEDFAIPPGEVLSWERLPERIAVVGAGATGVQLASIFRRFGASVYLIERDNTLCRELDPEGQTAVRESLQTAGVQIFLSNEITSVSDAPGGAKRLRMTAGSVVLADAVVVCTGTRPQAVHHMNLSAGRVEFSERGVKTSGHHFRTTNKRIFAVGDVREESFGLWSTALDEARAVAEYIRTADTAVVPLQYPPRVIWTCPAIAQVGRCREELEREKIAYDEVMADFRDGTRAQIDNVPRGYTRMFLRRNTETLLGCLVVHHHAAEMISEFSLLVNHELPLSALANVAHSDTAMISPIANIAARHAARIRTKSAKHKATMDRLHRAQRQETVEAL